MNNLIFHQLFEKETSTYTYLLADATTREAIIIDSTIDTVTRDLKLIEELSLKLTYVLETHVHADHITGAWNLKEVTGAQIALSASSNAQGADVYLIDGQELTFGAHTITALSTPGHTDSCISYFIPGMVFTGDALLIRGTGRTDFQQGNAHTLFWSIRKKIFSLPDETTIYPGHDYHGHTSSTVLQEKQFNPRVRLENSEETFVEIMSQLKLDKPKRIHEAVPANMVCGNILHSDKQG
jgi:sulfur dioxygenase